MYYLWPADLTELSLCEGKIFLELGSYGGSQWKRREGVRDVFMFVHVSTYLHCPSDL